MSRAQNNTQSGVPTCHMHVGLQAASMLEVVKISHVNWKESDNFQQLETVLQIWVGLRGELQKSCKDKNVNFDSKEKPMCV